MVYLLKIVQYIMVKLSTVIILLAIHILIRHFSSVSLHKTFFLFFLFSFFFSNFLFVLLYLFSFFLFFSLLSFSFFLFFSLFSFPSIFPFAYITFFFLLTPFLFFLFLSSFFSLLQSCTWLSSNFLRYVKAPFIGHV